ncbi:MAG: hypothetical protein WCO48_02655 [Candidatus Taylorbacteria bacterium]
MNTKTLSPGALVVIDQYTNFSVGTAVCSIPYFNNKTVRARGALRAYGGKGSPKDIFDEVTASLTKEHVSIDVLTDESLKKYVTDKKIGIDCSGFAYYILNAECEAQGKGSLSKHIHFTNAKGLIGKIRSMIRPVENCSVITLADEKNSQIIDKKDIQPGDMIVMIAKDGGRDHILVIDQVDYIDLLPKNIHYVHASAYPDDGVYGNGIKSGEIEITDSEKDIVDESWSEVNMFARLNDYSIKIRRLR